MNAHAELFPQIPAIVKALPDPIDQMKFFELIQIIPSPTRAALGSGNLTGYRISDPTIMGFLRNNSIFTFGQADRAKTSATFREILDAMWLFNDKFERALAKFNEIKAEQQGVKRPKSRQHLFRCGELNGSRNTGSRVHAIPPAAPEKSTFFVTAYAFQVDERVSMRSLIIKWLGRMSETCR